MSHSERLAIAAHLHVLLRRKLGRVTDTEWMASNVDYGREIVRVCLAEEDPELREWARRLDAALPSMATVATARTERVPHAPWHAGATEMADGAARKARTQIEQRYVGRLR